MTVWKITYRASALAAPTFQSVEADYFKLEDEWFTFKTNDHKAVLSANALDVRTVERVDEKPAN